MHGHVEAATTMLARDGLVDPSGRWTGGASTLWFIGDLVDRGPDGIGAVELVMRLQDEASADGGTVGCLLGNHEAYLLSAYRFGGRHVLDWIQAGGTLPDLERMRPELAEWMERLPALALVGDTLLVHADGDFYLRYGSSVDEVNASIVRILQTRDPDLWKPLLARFGQKHAFRERRDKGTNAKRFVETFGAARLVHGHTPVCHVLDVDPETVTEPLVYARGVCMNIDGALYRGGPGFVVRLA